MTTRSFIGCGMYAFTPALQAAWQELLSIAWPHCGFEGDLPEIVFETDEAKLRDPNLVFGHTCGYPLMTRLQDQLTPLCTPIFDVPGCRETSYSSRFIVPQESGIDSLEACRNRIVAINTADSNSGMNVLRYALARLGAEAPFFEQVEYTGGHRQSLEAVAAGRAQLAAIDCVSYQLIMDAAPHLAESVRSIEFSVQTPGLPLVTSRSRLQSLDRDDFVDALNQALQDMSQDKRRCLHLQGFRAIDLEPYEAIVELERFAGSAGYPQLK